MNKDFELQPNDLNSSSIFAEGERTQGNTSADSADRRSG